MSERYERLMWAVLFHSKNRLDGDRRDLLGAGDGIQMFHTRREARAWANEKFGYMRKRPDLKAEPHGWKSAKPVRVREIVELA